MSGSVPPLKIHTLLDPFQPYSDSRSHGYQGPTRNVRGGAVAKHEDGVRCAVAGKESLRILRLTEPGETPTHVEHKNAIGRGGFRIDASRNLWEASGLKIDSASTDVAWGFGWLRENHSAFNHKILTSARNGELIMWDLNKAGTTKYDRKMKEHLRSIHKLDVSHIVPHYCVTGSADGDVRVWDLRELKSVIKVHHPTSVRSVVFSPSVWQPLQAITGLDNGSIYRWDLRMGQRGTLDRLPVAHTASVTSLDWRNASGSASQPISNVLLPVNGTSGAFGGGGTGSILDGAGSGLGWLISGGLDRCVKVWDLTSPALTSSTTFSANASNNSLSGAPHIPHKPTYVLHPSFPVRKVLWRPGYDCELTVVSNAEFSQGSESSEASSVQSIASSTAGVAPGILTRVGSGLGLEAMMRGIGGSNSSAGSVDGKPPTQLPSPVVQGDAIEIWDVRRGWVAKWSIPGSAAEGGVTDLVFNSPSTIWTQHTSGMFMQLDLRTCTAPLESIPRVALAWEASGAMAFVSDKRPKWEVPYDDMNPEQRFQPSQRKLVKSLGDPAFKPRSQCMGTWVPDYSFEEREVVIKLARGYQIEGKSKSELCAWNSEIALQAGQDKLSNTWKLMQTSLTDFTPPRPPPVTDANGGQSNAVPPSHNFPTRPGPEIGTSLMKTSPSRGTMQSGRTPNRSPSAPKRSASRMTPSSSTSSSPRHMPHALPHTLTHPHHPPFTPRRPSFFDRMESIDSSRRPSVYRPATQHSHSPSERSTLSVKHAGEGLLDDSDSSGCEKENEEENHSVGVETSDDELARRANSNPSIPQLVRGVAVPSPLSRVVVGQHNWKESEEKTARNRRFEDSNHDSDDPVHKSRSRSSTLASLPAPPPSPRDEHASLPTPSRGLVHQDSHSSIRTVTAVEASLQHQEGVKHEENLRPGHDQPKSRAISEHSPERISLVGDSDKNEKSKNERFGELTDRNIDVVRGEELRIREMCWDALRKAIEDFADEGDVQMCAMMAIIAADELRITKKRILRLLDAYNEDVRKVSLLETTIYTSCGKCGKPLIKPAGACTMGDMMKGGFSYCLSCKTPCIDCAICHLPVRALLFQCSVCHHGGHQECYRQYYMQHAMIDLPRSLPAHDSRGRTATRSRFDGLRSTGNTPFVSGEQSPVGKGIYRRLVGHPCAAGCGHYCWAANDSPNDL
ncbi:hypothetical protein BDQ17DRAFT_1394052 [Cyathus striatus]|nr:hypothetical protein BDQ17DRAFT_1394052 [Cyathus striatus]